ncbi:alpha/beta fold hydrolase [bacterium]|nr:alpha/beta fold hydrolase [bacterium]
MLNMILHRAKAETEHPGTDEPRKDRPTLVIAHGLFGSGRNWGVIARNLATRRDVVAVDMRNHGFSPRRPTQSYPDMAEDLAEVIGAIGAPVDLLGHSMGGKAAMTLALTHPGLLRRLVVADIAPVAYGHDQSQHIKAMRGLDRTGLTSRMEADRRLALTVADPALRAFFLQSLDLKVQPAAWRINLDVLEAEMDKIVGWPDLQGEFKGPTLFLAGSESTYIRPENRETIRRLFPAARFAKLMGAGHWLHADKPREFETTVRLFLDA